MNPLSLLSLQNKSFDPKVLEQAQELFEKISRAILKDQNFIEWTEPIYPVNRFCLQNKGYFVLDDRIVWGEFILKFLNLKNLGDGVDNDS